MKNTLKFFLARRQGLHQLRIENKKLKQCLELLTLNLQKKLSYPLYRNAFSITPRNSRNTSCSTIGFIFLQYNIFLHQVPYIFI